jgi:general secretion pathway protein G
MERIEGDYQMVEKRRRGFTIIELLAVVLIISMIAVFFGRRVFTGLGKTKTKIAKAKMAIIDNALGRFYLDCGRFPDDSEGLEVLLVAPADVEDKWAGPYAKRSELLDPWDNPYEYYEQGAVNVGSYDIVSFGADGVEGGEGENGDIYND